MTWILSLARSGGTAGSHGGHETRRHRVRGPFPMGACLLLAGTLALAGCGSSSNSTVTINGQQPQSEPEIDPQTGNGDGGQTVTQQQQQQPQPEPEPEPQTGGGSGEGEGDGSGGSGSGDQGAGGQGAGGGTPPTEDGDGDTDSGDTTSTDDGGQTRTQQLPPQPSNQPPPQTGGGSGGGTGGGGNPPPNNPVVSRSVTPSGSTEFTGFPTVGGSSILDSITATYTRQYGFQGEYVYKGASGQFSSDVKLIFTLDETSARIRGYLGDDIVMNFIEGLNIKKSDTWYGLLVDATVDTEQGSFTVTDPEFGFYAYGNLDDSPSRVNRTDSGTGTIEATFSNGGSDDDLPSIIKGEVEVTGFRRKAAGSDNYESGDGNRLTGRFSSDFVSDVKVIKLEGNIDMFSYGIWVNDNFLDKRIVFLEQTTKFNPGRTASDYTSHQTLKSDNFIYKRENGFKGVYIYEGETGELTGDVDLRVRFSDSSILDLFGSISTDLEIEGNDLSGIILSDVQIDASTGVLGELPSYSILRFGSWDASDGGISLKTIHNKGQAKLRVALSSDGRQAQDSTPETYPSQIAGELEINGFKIYSDDGDNNTVVGVFVGDKQE